MIYVGVRDLKARLSEYLDKAKLGDEIVVTEHGKPIARLVKEPVKQKSVIERIYNLVEKGLVELPTKDKSSKSSPPFKSNSNTSSSDLLLRDR